MNDDDDPTASSTPWWREAVIYQIYVRSFADANGDGMGDLAGIRSRLQYLHRLGIDAVWLTPFYPSPQADAGYDVANYRDVDPIFGTLADLDGIIAHAHALGIRIIVDIVPNHTSSDHPWFQAALAAGAGSRERLRYMFRDGRGPGGIEPPNDWNSAFGGPAWTRVADDGAPGQWYLHLFAPGQPDLNWTNEEVADEFESILRFWLDHGVDGFRIDVAHGLAKDPEMPDLGERLPTGGPSREGHPHWDVDEVHDVYRRWRKVIDSYGGARVFVGEIWVDSPQRMARYLRPGELHTAFNFPFLIAPWDAAAMRGAIDSSIQALVDVGAPTTWVLSNHDVIRHVTRYGGGTVGVARARAAAMLMLALPGGSYIYQGEELGLPEVLDLPDDKRQDPLFARTGGELKGRDGCRVPIPWSGQSPPFGFGPGPEAWLPQPPAWADLTVEHQLTEPGSMLSLYIEALRIRRQHHALGDGEITWIDPGRDLLAFRREPGFTCVVNFSDAPVSIAAELSRSGGRVILASAPLDADDRIPAAAAIWIDDRMHSADR